MLVSMKPDRPSSRLTAGVRILLASAAGAACIACANSTDITANAFDAAREAGATGGTMDARPGDAATATGDGEAGASDPCDCLAVGQAYRFDALALTELDGGPHPAVPVLNNRWKKDIAAHELDVYFLVTSVDGERVGLRAVNATEVAGGPDGEECELSDTAVEFTLQRRACTLTMDTPAGINIYSGNTAIPKNCGPSLTVPNTIPVGQVRLQFDVSAGCEALTRGIVLEASIARAALQNICTCLANDASQCPGPTESPGCAGCPGAFSNLETLVKAVNGGREPSYSCLTAEGDPSVCVAATFSAKRSQSTPAPCP